MPRGRDPSMSTTAISHGLLPTFKLAATCVFVTLAVAACGNNTAAPPVEPGAWAKATRRPGSDSDTRTNPERDGARADQRAEVGRAEAGGRRAEGNPRAKAERRAEPRVERRAGRVVRVLRVIDGDTIEVQLHGTTGIRLIGIDTPETVHPTEPVGCFGLAASSFTKRMLEGQMVRLEYDVERSDHYGRTLAYVFVDGLLFNRTLVARGYAQVTTYPPNEKYVDRFLTARRGAREANRGFWGRCSNRPDGDALATSNGGRTGGVSGTGDGRCDLSYSGACIPVFPPDIDCPDVGAEGFRSTASDPHGFDADGGIACD